MAIALQEDLRSRVSHSNKYNLDQIHTVAGVDAAYDDRKDGQGFARAAVVVLSFPDLDVIEQATAVVEGTFPYTPGLLSFREGPAVLAAIAKLKTTPDVLIFDGHGYAHPLRFGLASHLGVYLGRPSVGCAKTRLMGGYQALEPDVGDRSPLVHDNTTVARPNHNSGASGHGAVYYKLAVCAYSRSGKR